MIEITKLLDIAFVFTALAGAVQPINFQISLTIYVVPTMLCSGKSA